MLSPAQLEEDGERRLSTMGNNLKRATVNGFKHINVELEKSVPADEVNSLSPSAMVRTCSNHGPRAECGCQLASKMNWFLLMNIAEIFLLFDCLITSKHHDCLLP